MENNHTIFLFVKDRLNNLENTLSFLGGSSYSVIVVDDSTDTINREKIQSLTTTCNNLTYCGLEFYNVFLKKYNIPASEYSFLIRELGHVEWNLGYARNIGLLIAKALKVDKACFIDDDIIIDNISLIDEMFAELDCYSFAGCKITGLRDDSIVGHISDEMGMTGEQILSGGFMFFKPSIVSHYFLNVYNEDWIWVLLHLNDNEFNIKNEVLQSYADPYNQYEIKLPFQEYGEIILAGLIKHRTGKSLLLPLSPSFWRQEKRNRLEYLKKLEKELAVLSKPKLYQIIKFAIIEVSSIKETNIEREIGNYLSQLGKFQLLYNAL